MTRDQLYIEARSKAVSTLAEVRDSSKWEGFVGQTFVSGGRTLLPETVARVEHALDLLGQLVDADADEREGADSED